MEHPRNQRHTTPPLMHPVEFSHPGDERRTGRVAPSTADQPAHVPVFLAPGH